MTDVIVEFTEFEMGEVLAINISTDGNQTPYFYITWKGKRKGLQRHDYMTTYNIYHTIRQVLYDLYGWDYCVECQKSVPKVKNYLIAKKGWSAKEMRLCPFHYNAYEELYKSGEYSHLQELEPE